MYKLLHDNKAYILVSIIVIVYLLYNLIQKPKKETEIENKKVKEKKRQNTTSILPDPRKRLENINNDIQYLHQLTNNITDDQIKLIQKYYKEPEIYFLELCENKKIKFDKKKVNKLVKYLDSITLSIKNKYKIPRPYILGKTLDIKINNLATPESYSYPCGKVLKSKMLSHYFSYLDPRYDYEFQQITKDIELTCLYAGINTPLDIRGSLLLSQKMMQKKVLKKFI